MDIIKLIKAQQKIFELDIDSNAKSLAILLTVKANQFGRGENEFFLTDKDLKTFLGFSLKTNHTLINARKVLVDKGMIEYTKGKKGVKSTYRVNWNKIINFNSYEESSGKQKGKTIQGWKSVNCQSW